MIIMLPQNTLYDLSHLVWENAKLEVFFTKILFLLLFTWAHATLYAGARNKVNKNKKGKQEIHRYKKSDHKSD